MTYEAIANQFQNVSFHQVEHVVHQDHPTPKKHSGRPLFITDDQLNDLITFVCASRHNCRLPWAQLPREYPMCTWKNASEWLITSALRRAGF